MAIHRPTFVSTSQLAVWLAVAVLAGCSERPQQVENEVEHSEVYSHPERVKAEGITFIPIVDREHGYRNFESQVLASEREYDLFVASVIKQGGWNRKAEILSAFEQAQIDFDRSSLVLIRSTAGSGSIKVYLDPPTLEGNELVFRFAWDEPGVLTMDMAYYCYAAIVPKDIAESVRVVSPYSKDAVLPLRRQLSAN